MKKITFYKQCPLVQVYADYRLDRVWPFFQKQYRLNQNDMELYYITRGTHQWLLLESGILYNTHASISPEINLRTYVCVRTDRGSNIYILQNLHISIIICIYIYVPDSKFHIPCLLQKYWHFQPISWLRMEDMPRHFQIHKPHLPKNNNKYLNYEKLNFNKHVITLLTIL